MQYQAFKFRAVICCQVNCHVTLATPSVLFFVSVERSEKDPWIWGWMWCSRMGCWGNIAFLFQGNLQIESGLHGAFQAAEGVCRRERHLAAALLSAAIRVLQISHQGKYQ